MPSFCIGTAAEATDWGLAAAPLNVPRDLALAPAGVA